MNTVLWICALVAVGALGWLVVVVVDYLPARRLPTPVVSRAKAAPRPVMVPGRRYTAAEILGYRDLGGRRVAPTCPLTRDTASSAEALAAWDARTR